MAQPLLDITLIPTYSLKTLGIADISVYPNNFQVLNPNIEITAPGMMKVSITFNPKAVNIFNSNNINLTRATNFDQLASLPDGIYTIKYSIAPNHERFVEKSFMRVDKLECKFAQTFLYLDLDDDSFKDVHKNKINSLKKARMFIDGSVAAMNECDSDLALKLYQKADSLLDRIIEGECKCD